MAQTPETRLANEIKSWCGEHNWLCYHCINGTFYGRDGVMIRLAFPKGFPDLLILTDYGQAIFVETKVKPNKPTPEQVKFISELQARGFIASVIYSMEEWLNLINSHARI